MPIRGSGGGVVLISWLVLFVSVGILPGEEHRTHMAD